MVMETILSALVGGLSGGLLAYLTTVRNIYNVSVVQERKTWREKVRSLSVLLAEALERKDHVKVSNIRKRLQIRLNPSDPEDRKILTENDPEELLGRVSVLLKHDWERAKQESSLISNYYTHVNRPEYRFRQFRFGRLVVLIGLMLLFLPYIWDLLSPFIKQWWSVWHDWLIARGLIDVSTSVCPLRHTNKFT